jgi:hypothetical protein
MAPTDTLTGRWVARLAATTSRWISGTIAALCLLLAAAGLTRMSESLAPLMSVTSIAAILAAYLIAKRTARHGTEPQ